MQKNGMAQKKASKKAEGKGNHVITSTVELKTSTPSKTRTEQIKMGYSNVNDYSKYLQNKYSYMNTGTASMQGVPTTVSVSGALIILNKRKAGVKKYKRERRNYPL